MYEGQKQAVVVLSGEAVIEAPARSHRWLAGLLPFVAVAVLVGGVAGNAALRALVAAAWARISWQAVLATLPGQLAANLFYAGALFAMRPGVSFAASFFSRLLRDAGCNLLLVMPGLGEAIGARVLVLRGARGRTAITATTLDALAEAVAQLPYIALAIAVLPRFWSMMRLPLPRGGGAFAAAVAGLVLVAGAVAWVRRPDSVSWGNTALIRRLRIEITLLRREMRRQHGGFPAAIAFHFCGWGMGGLQLWMASRALGMPLSPFAALAIDSVAYAARGIVFFVPAGVVLQEAGLVGAGLVFGLAPAQALALGLVLRLRDVVFGVSLLAWPVLEWRRNRRHPRGL
jgi:hypothetical protein